MFVMILFGAISRYVHGRYFVKVPHIKRIGLAAILILISFILIAIACFYDHLPWMFWIAVMASILTGI